MMDTPVRYDPAVMERVSLNTVANIVTAVCAVILTVKIL